MRKLCAALIVAISIFGTAPAFAQSTAFRTLEDRSWGTAFKYWSTPFSGGGSVGCGKHGPSVPWVGCGVYVIEDPDFTTHGWTQARLTAESLWDVFDTSTGKASSGELLWEYINCPWPCNVGFNQNNEPRAVLVNTSDHGGPVDVINDFDTYCVLAETSFNANDGNGKILASLVWVNTISHCNIDYHIDGTVSESEVNLTRLMTHELGHALGLDHAPGGQMQSGESGQPTFTGLSGDDHTLTDGDRYGINYLYSSHPNDFEQYRCPC
jgi:hypothetical protein